MHHKFLKDKFSRDIGYLNTIHPHRPEEESFISFVYGVITLLLFILLKQCKQVCSGKGIHSNYLAHSSNAPNAPQISAW